MVNLIYEVILICTFVLGLAGALVNDHYLTALGLTSALCCFVILSTREK